MTKEIKKDWLCFKFFADTRGGYVIDWEKYGVRANNFSFDKH